ncbi:unnamed protein product [Brachionus calyciflorus]|uniref:Uncharacterized protein n=1 Tax=Brachionus calyciflorus TaxID=104777 RepID=A0A813N2F1_9BILA|nr:unnamed protein product [Brachionus calyciflorus]
MINRTNSVPMNKLPSRLPNSNEKNGLHSRKYTQNGTFKKNVTTETVNCGTSSSGTTAGSKGENKRKSRGGSDSLSNESVTEVVPITN